MSRRIGILGVGAVGARTARQLLTTSGETDVVLQDPDATKVEAAARSLGAGVSILTKGDIVDQRVDALVVAAPCRRHMEPVRRAVAEGVPVISTSDRIEDVEAIVALDSVARRSGAVAVAGVAFAPGLTCVLACLLSQRFDVVDEVHIAKQGTGGPACAHQHHRALSSSARDWRDGGWVRRAGGSGRELVWFPEPIGGSDCYRAALPDAWLLKPAFPDARRLTARMAASRQDRFTSWLPMLSPPHPEGDIGAVRIELRGRVGTERAVQVAGAVERPALAAAAVIATTIDAVLEGWGPPAGARGLAGVVDPRQFLRRLATRGLSAQEFAGLDEAS